MKKMIIAVVLLLLATTVFASVYLCTNYDCAMWVIEDDAGFTWLIECVGEDLATGRVDGATYGGSCQKLQHK